VILATITGANLFTEPYLLTNGGGPDGASSVTGARDVPEGHRAGEPRRRLRDRRDPRDRVLLISLVNRAPGEGLRWHRHARDRQTARAEAPAQSQPPGGSWTASTVLLARRGVFLFPFYYMVVGSLQAEAGHVDGGAFPTGG
jgi:hypothetical protein